MSQLYRLMIYFAHSTLVIYSKDIHSYKKMNVDDFMIANRKILQRVFDEGLTIMNYELSNEQMERACAVYLQAEYYPSSIDNTTPYIISNALVEAREK